MSMMDNLRNKAEQYAADNPDKVEQISDQAIERAGDMIDERTGGKYSGQVDQAQRAADDRIGQTGDEQPPA